MRSSTCHLRPALLCLLALSSLVLVSCSGGGGGGTPTASRRPALSLRAKVVRSPVRPGEPIQLRVAEVASLALDVHNGQDRASGVFSSTRIDFSAPSGLVDIELPGLVQGTYLVVVRAASSQGALLAETGCLFPLGPSMTTDMGLVVSSAGLALSGGDGCAQPAQGLVPRLVVQEVAIRPGSITAGGLLAMTLTARNDGELTAIDVLPSVAFDKGGSDAGSWFTVGRMPQTTSAGSGLAPLEVRSLEPGRTITFEAGILVARTAPAGDVTILAGVRGEGTSLALGTPASVTVLAPSSLALDGPLRAPATVSSGQSFVASFTVANSGDVAAIVSGAVLAFVGPGVGVTARTGNPSSVPPRGRSVFVFDALAQPGSLSGPCSAIATIRAAEQTTGFDCSLSSALTGGLTVQTPAELSGLPVVQVPAAVSQGQTFTATIQVTNTGQATARLDTVTLVFSPPDGLTVTALEGPSSLSGGQTGSYRFQVTVAEAAAIGARSLDVGVSARDVNSGADVSSSRPAVASIVVLSTSRLQLTGGLRAPARASQGQSFVASLTVTNTGQTAAILTDATLAFSGGGLTAVAGASGPTTVPPLQSVDLFFDVTVDATAAAGVRTATATVEALDAATGASRSLAATALGQVLVLRPAALVLAGALRAPSLVSQGQAFVASFTVANSGEETARVSGAALTFAGTGLDVSPADTNSAVLAGGTSAVFSFDVAVNSSAVPGVRTASITVSATAELSGRDAGIAAAGLGGPTVERPASLRLLGALQAPALVSRNSTFLASFTVTNDGEAAARFTSSGLTFSGSGLVASARPTNAPTVAGSTSVVLAFDVAVSPSCPAGPQTAAGFVGGVDANSGASLQASTSAFGAVTVRTPADVSTISELAPGAVAAPGETVLQAVQVTNTGQTAASITTVTLAFDDPSALTVAPLSATSVIAADATTTFLFRVSVASDAGASSRRASVTVQARDVATGADVSATRADAGSLTIELLRLEVTDLDAPQQANRGQLSVPVTVVVSNPLVGSVKLTGASLTLAGSLVPATVATALPLPVGGKSSGRLDLTMDVPSTAPLGQCALSVRVGAVHDSSGQALVATGPATAQVRLDAPSRQLTALVNGLDGIDRAGPPLILTVSLTNGNVSTATARLTRMTVSYSSASGPSTDGGQPYTQTAMVELPTLSGGSSGQLPISVAALANARMHEPITATFTLVSQDQNDLTTSAATVQHSWYVREAATHVVGQPDLRAGQVNRGFPVPAADSLNSPSSVAVAGDTLFIGDRYNNRVLSYRSLQPTTACSVLGQASFSTAVSGSGAASMAQPIGLAITGTRLIVADCYNHRVLIFNDLTRLPATGATADIILGPGIGPGATQMTYPHFLAIDSDRLYVTDWGNSRLLVFHPLSTLTTGAAASGVLGQADFASTQANRGGSPAADSMAYPGGLAAANGRLFVGDYGNHRVLVYDNVSAKGNGAPADHVIGQAELTSGSVNRGGSTSARSLSSPIGLALGGNRLFVCDTGNKRVLYYSNVFSQLDSLGNDLAADGVLGQATFAGSDVSPVQFPGPDAFSLSYPYGAFASSADAVYVAEWVAHRMLRLPIP